MVAAGTRIPPPRERLVGLHLRGIQDRLIDQQRVTGRPVRHRKLLELAGELIPLTPERISGGTDPGPDNSIGGHRGELPASVFDVAGECQKPPGQLPHGERITRSRITVQIEHRPVRWTAHYPNPPLRQQTSRRERVDTRSAEHIPRVATTCQRSHDGCLTAAQH